MPLHRAKSIREKDGNDARKRGKQPELISISWTVYGPDSDGNRILLASQSAHFTCCQRRLLRK